jgi:RNA polymerase sigma-70 factor (ECF subfamily)
MSQALSEMTDEEIVSRVLAGGTLHFEAIMRRYNQRVFRAARALLRDDAMAEDLVQEAWVRAYEHLDKFEGRSSFSTWILRIAIHEGLKRKRSSQRYANAEEPAMERFASLSPDPEQQAAAAQIRELLERLIDSLPESNRTVFVLREIEGLDTRETSEALDLTEENVKVRLHRARSSLREMITTQIGARIPEAFAFQGSRCDRIVARVLERVLNKSYSEIH